MFCPECGADHHVADRAAEAAADREVTLAKIEADKEIKIEQIRAGAARDLAEVDNALKTERAEGIAEGMETALDAATGGAQAEEPGEPGEPVIVETPPAEEPAPTVPDMAPPEVIETSSPSSRSSGGGWWDGYGR
jgi:hypothetical protein